MMKKKCSRAAVFGILLLSCSFIPGCGCGKAKDADPESQQVLEITIAPELTPTPEPEEINPDAVVTNGNITMVNEYLSGGQKN